eukprot:2071224-Pleurochrysis_carterae.AAC.2
MPTQAPWNLRADSRSNKGTSLARMRSQRVLSRQHIKKTVPHQIRGTSDKRRGELRSLGEARRREGRSSKPMPVKRPDAERILHACRWPVDIRMRASKMVIRH